MSKNHLMKQNVRITAMYQKYSSAEAKKFIIEPYCVKLFHRRWYVLGRIADSDDFRTLSFDRIKTLTITGIKFEMDADFDAEQYFNDSFGIVNDDNTQVEKVVLRAFGMERFYMDLYYIMEQLTTLRPDVVQRLLEATNNYRVKRMFLYMAEKAGHYWFEELCLEKIKLGDFKVQLVPDGIYNAKYKMTIPKALNDYEG